MGGGGQQLWEEKEKMELMLITTVYLEQGIKANGVYCTPLGLRKEREWTKTY